MKTAQVRRFALSLPAVTEEPHFHYSSFRIRGKIFKPKVVTRLLARAWTREAPKSLQAPIPSPHGDCP